MTESPRRLLEDPTARPALREDLARARTSSVAVYDADAGLTRFQAAVAGAAVAAAGAGGAAGTPAALAPGKAAFGAGAKWLALVIAGAVGAAAGVLVRGPAEPSAERARPAIPGRAAAPRADRVPVDMASAHAAYDTSAPTPVEPAAAPVLPPSLPRAPSSVLRTRPTSPAIAVDPDARLRAETAALAEARRQLARSPARALALVEQGRRQFPNGMFGEEREAIAIFALNRLGRASDAQRRARAFLARYPDGPFSHEIRRLAGEAVGSR